MSARRKFLLWLGFLGVLYAVLTVTDTATDSVDLPFVPDLSLNGREVPTIRGGAVISAAELTTELRETFPGLRSADIRLADRTYQAVDHADLEALIRFMSEFYWESPALRYAPESYDCDNYARTFTVVADLAKAPGFTGQAGILRIYVRQQAPWGGVAAGGAHALVVFRSDRGLYVYEPQGRSLIAAARYPNRTSLMAVKGD